MMKARLIIILIVFLFSCSSNMSFFLRDCEKPYNIKTVAVLPFKNISNWRGAGKIISSMFVQELFNSGIYSVVDMGNIRDFFVRQRVRIKGEIDLDTISMLGSQLGIDAVFLGIVEEYYQDIGGKGGTSPQLAFSVRMLNTKNGSILWKCYHSRTGDDYNIILDWGKVRTINLLAKKVIREMIATMR